MDTAIFTNREAIIEQNSEIANVKTETDGLKSSMNGLSERLRVLEELGGGGSGEPISPELIERISKVEQDVIELNNELDTQISLLQTSVAGLVNKDSDLQKQIDEINEKIENSGGSSVDSEVLDEIFEDIKELQNAVFDISESETKIIQVNTIYDLPTVPDDPEGTYYYVSNVNSTYKYEGGHYRLLQNRVNIIDGGGAI